MQVEIVAFWGFICLLLIALAELKAEFKILGLIGCILLVPLAFAIWLTGIEVQTGQFEQITTVQNIPINTSTIIFLAGYRIKKVIA